MREFIVASLEQALVLLNNYPKNTVYIEAFIGEQVLMVFRGDALPKKYWEKKKTIDNNCNTW